MTYTNIYQQSMFIKIDTHNDTTEIITILQDKEMTYLHPTVDLQLLKIYFHIQAHLSGTLYQMT